MAAARFCSECGKQLKVKRAGRLPFHSFCPHCSPRFERARLMLIAVPFLCAAIGFAVGRYSTAREPFYFIGTPIELSASGIATPPEYNAARPSRPGEPFKRPEQLVISSSSTEGICGARTKSGKPCQRKVKGGGYCWQHRDRPGEKKPPRPTQ